MQGNKGDWREKNKEDEKKKKQEKKLQYLLMNALAKFCIMHTK